MVEILLERLAGLGHHWYLTALEALAAPDDQRAATCREDDIGELKGSGLTDTRAGVTHQADQRQRQTVVACDPLLGGTPHSIPLGAVERLWCLLHSVDGIDPAKGVIVAAAVGVAEQGEAD